MQRFCSLMLIFVFVVVITSLPFSLAAQDTHQSALHQEVRKWNPAEQELWDLEHKYMQYYKDKNIDGLLTIYHDKCVVWPESSEHPLDLSSAKAFVKQPSDITIVTFKIRPQAIAMLNNIAIVYYYIDCTLANEQVITFRITHTWLKKMGKWRIMGGMSSK
jgi:hypothetical protein